MMKWIYAKLNLALALIIHLAWMRWFQRKGLKHFLKFYNEDRVFALSFEERLQSASFSNCIFCGLCVTQCENTHPQFFQVYTSPASGAFTLTRSLPEISLNQDFSDGCPSCHACEKVCPTGVPLTQISDFIKKHVHP